MDGRLDFLAAALLPVIGEFCCLSYRMSCYFRLFGRLGFFKLYLVLSEIFLEDFVIGSLRMQEFIYIVIFIRCILSMAVVAIFGCLVVKFR